MPMTLWFKRAKNFVMPSGNDHGEKKFVAMPGPNPTPVPFWVSETKTFTDGIKDGSIVNLTPPHLMPGYKAPSVVEEASVEEQPIESVKEMTEAEKMDAVEALAEQGKDGLPQPVFGGQPMTPVPSAIKIGKVKRG